jgi:hypothetical protein
MNRKRRSPQIAARALVVPKPAIDYPLENERVGSDGYTIRVNAPQARLVRVAINQGEWLECRPAVGFWWFDWSGIAPGEHEIVACADYEDGREAVSMPAHCLVSER